MKTLKSELAKLDNEMAARRNGLLAAAGRIAEAETMAVAINKKVDDKIYSAACVITSHQSGDVNVRVLVMANHAQVRSAIEALGWVVSSEVEIDDSLTVTSIIHLRDLDGEIHMYREPQAIAVAA